MGWAAVSLIVILTTHYSQYDELNTLKSNLDSIKSQSGYLIGEVDSLRSSNTFLEEQAKTHTKQLEELIYFNENASDLKTSQRESKSNYLVGEIIWNQVDSIRWHSLLVFHSKEKGRLSSVGAVLEFDQELDEIEAIIGSYFMGGGGFGGRNLQYSCQTANSLSFGPEKLEEGYVIRIDIWSKDSLGIVNYGLYPDK